MTQLGVPLDLGVMWEPNAPGAVLVSTDGGRAALALNAHASDEGPAVSRARVEWLRCSSDGAAE